MSLLRDSVKDEATLNNLESKFRLISLEQSKIKDPWELITKPTITENRLYPKRLKNISIYGVSLGFFLSYLFSYLLEIKSGKIFSLDKILSLIKYPVLLKLYKGDKEKWKDNLSIFLK